MDVNQPQTSQDKPIEKVNVSYAPQADNSQILGVSLRGWIALIIVLTVCLMSGLGVEIAEPLYTLSGMVLAFYFGHQTGSSSKKL